MEYQMIVLNSSDNSLVAYVLTPTDKIKDSPPCVDANKRIILDSLSTQDYTYQFDYPYFESPVLDLNDELVKQIVVFIDCDKIADFLRISGMKFYFLHYGYTVYSNFEELTNKYGFIVLNEGCVSGGYSSDVYMTKVKRLLDIRNGVGWIHHYYRDMKKLESQRKLEKINSKLTPEYKFLIRFVLR